MKLLQEMLQEATIKQELPKNKITLKPAQLTFKEWYKLVNPSNKNHDSTAYNWDVATMNKNEWDTTDEENIGKVYVTKKLKGRTIDFHGKAEVNKYTKRDANGEYVRTEDGDLLYYTKDELELLGYNLYNYKFTAVDVETNQIVGVAQDEWGALLISVAAEYRGFGIGEQLGVLMRSYVPDYDSGGVTENGYNNLYRVYRQFVNMAAERGDYTKWVNNGEMTAKKAIEIISQARETRKIKSELQRLELKTVFGNKPEDWLWCNYNDMVIVYNRKLLDLFEEDFGEYDSAYWREQIIDEFIVGAIYIGAGPTSHKELNIWQFGGINEKIKQEVFNVGLGLIAEEYPEYSVRVLKSISKHINDDLVEYGSSRNSNEVLIKPIGYTKYAQDVRSKFHEEKRIRGKVDKYDEMVIQIAEAATAKYDDYHKE